MVRRVFLSLTLLLFAITGMLLWQWEVYSEEQLENAKLPNVQQYVQIQHSSNELLVVQTIKNLKKGTYTIHNPLRVTNRVESAVGVRASSVVIETQEDVDIH